MVGIVIVSHSWKIAEGICDLAAQVAGTAARIISAGGMQDGEIGTDAVKISEAIRAADSGDGVVVLADLGSGIIQIELTDDALAVPGRCLCDLCMTKNEQVLSTDLFVIDVVASPNVSSGTLT